MHFEKKTKKLILTAECRGFFLSKNTLKLKLKQLKKDTIASKRLKLFSLEFQSKILSVKLMKY